MPTSEKAWYEIKAHSDKGAKGVKAEGGKRSAEIYIYGDIGNRWDENSITAANFVRDLQLLPADKICVRINSLGGSVNDGLAIFNALKRHPASIDMQIDGLAVSCASLIAMAGDTITMAENSLMMIHAPWAGTYGNAKDLRDCADMLDKYAAAMATSYSAKSGKSAEDVLTLLTDGEDHWYTAQEAMDAGFADSVGPAIDANAALRIDSRDLSRFTPPAAAAAFTRKEKTMPQATPAAATPANPAAPQPTVINSRTKEQNAEILAMFQPFETRAGVAALQTAILTDPAISVEAASSQLLTHLGKEAAPANPQGAAPNIQTLVDERDKFRSAAAAALMVRAGVDREGVKDIRANPYRGHTLLDLARASLAALKINTDGMTKMELVAAAFTQSTSDFPILLENAMHKTLQAAYALQADTWKRFCAIGTVSDFRAHPRYRVGSFSNLDSLNEQGEFRNKPIPDGEKASITADTKGNIINLSRQAIINDDIGAFIGLSQGFGRAAARTIESDVYALFALNSGKGPTMPDGLAMFHASHGNLVASGSGAVPSVTTIDAARVAMALQKEVSGNDYLNLVSSIWIGPMTLGSSVRVINGAPYDPDTPNKIQRPNPVQNLFRDIIDTPRLSGTAWYVLASSQDCPTFEVAFLDGQQEPYLELQNGFEVDGAQYKVRLDYGVAGLDYKGAQMNAGA